jgi:hypothetical protein
MPEGVKRNRFHPDDRVRATLSTCGRGACTYLQQIPLEHAAYPPAIVELKADRVLEKCTHRPVQYLNNVLEQDHRAIKRRDTQQPDKWVSGPAMLSI